MTVDGREAGEHALRIIRLVSVEDLVSVVNTAVTMLPYQLSGKDLPKYLYVSIKVYQILSPCQQSLWASQVHFTRDMPENYSRMHSKIPLPSA